MKSDKGKKQAQRFLSKSTIKLTIILMLQNSCLLMPGRSWFVHVSHMPCPTISFNRPVWMCEMDQIIYLALPPGLRPWLIIGERKEKKGESPWTGQLFQCEDDEGVAMNSWFYHTVTKANSKSPKPSVWGSAEVSLWYTTILTGQSPSQWMSASLWLSEEEGVGFYSAVEGADAREKGTK